MHVGGIEKMKERAWIERKEGWEEEKKGEVNRVYTYILKIHTQTLKKR